MSLRRGENGRSFLSLIFEVGLIAVGVFLGLWANNWHEDRQHRAQAEATLRNFATEMEANRQVTQSNRQYHEDLARELHAFASSKEPGTEERFNKEVHFLGVRPVNFEHTAWDLALATQGLSYLRPDLAFDVSRVYTQQSGFQRLQDSFLSATFTPSTLSNEDLRGLARAMEVYLVDVNIQEPAMLRSYDQVIPKLKSSLSGNTR
jgi:hypothetical protein